MISAVTSLLAAAGSIEEHSKTAFYLAGGLLVAFALGISAIGIRGAQTFPATRGARAGVCALAAVLVAAAMATAVITA
jgi:hypothetical protein